MAHLSPSARRRFARVGAGAGTCLCYRLPRAADRLPRAATLSREGKLRLRLVEHARTHGVSAAARHFGVARSTVYRWLARYDPRHLATLESRSPRPKRARARTWTAAQAAAVRAAREEFPRWGKDKLAIVLARRGVRLSVSMVGRILADLKRRRPYAIRKPKDHPVAAPGDLVQVDTMHLAPLPGVERRQFTAVDVVSRYGVVGVRGVATAGTARDFLGELLARAPFPVKAVQVDGGSEFKAEFEAACQERGLPLFVLPPRSPKLNGRVERLNRTFREECWELYAGDLELPPLQAALRTWEDAYNSVRPHQALGYLTPAAYLASLQGAHL